MKVLVAEDNNDNFMVIKANLKKVKGLELYWAKDGLEALEKLEEGLVPDIFLIDIMLPNMRGDDLICKIKKNEKYKNKPIIVITASIFAEMKEKYHDIGADEVLEKPFSRKELLNILEKYMSQGCHYGNP